MRTIEVEFLKKHGWTVECESPFEIRHTDGSFATGQAAKAVLDGLMAESDFRDASWIDSWRGKQEY